MNDKERLEEIKGSLCRFMTPKNKPCLFRDDADWLIQQAEELHGTKHKHGYKDMYGKCNKDFAELHQEKLKLEKAIETASDELGWGDAGSAVIRADRILIKALKGDFS